MSFQEKSTLAMTGILLAVFGCYFALVLGEVSRSPLRDVTYKGLMAPLVVALVILTAVAHAVIAATAPADADANDERDRSIGLRGGRIAGYVLVVGCVCGLTLAMVEADTFWIAQVLLGGLVLAELTEGVSKLVLYRRSA